MAAHDLDLATCSREELVAKVKNQRVEINNLSDLNRRALGALTPEHFRQPEVAEQFEEPKVGLDTPRCLGDSRGCREAVRYEGWARKVDPFTGEKTGMTVRITVCETHKRALIPFQGGE